jgi:hypothetical protein
VQAGRAGGRRHGTGGEQKNGQGGEDDTHDAQIGTKSRKASKQFFSEEKNQKTFIFMPT